jgi:hypothetical protein
MKLRRPANSRLRGGHGGGGRLDEFLPDLQAYLETEDEDGFIAFYESLPTDGEWTDEESKESSDGMRGLFRKVLADEKKQRARRWNF